jgi:hypothetical protein
VASVTFHNQIYSQNIMPSLVVHHVVSLSPWTLLLDTSWRNNTIKVMVVLMAMPLRFTCIPPARYHGSGSDDDDNDDDAVDWGTESGKSNEGCCCLGWELSLGNGVSSSSSLYRIVPLRLRPWSGTATVDVTTDEGLLMRLLMRLLLLLLLLGGAASIIVRTATARENPLVGSRQSSMV